MKKGIVIYKSKYGTTKKYAEWLAKEIEYELAEITKRILNKFHNIKM